jgi:hypothetical protein
MCVSNLQIGLCRKCSHLLAKAFHMPSFQTLNNSKQLVKIPPPKPL